jgi:hypothetical protein
MYPPRPILRTLPEFAGTAVSGARASAALIAFVVAEYLGGRSLRELAEPTGRSHGAVRNILQRTGVYRRAAGAPPVSTVPITDVT